MTNSETDLRTIQDTNIYVRSLIEKPNVVKDYFWLSGVVTYISTSQLGHVYFSVEDGQYEISCMLPNTYREKSIYIKKDTFIDVYGVLSVYVKQAKVTFVANDIRLPEFDSTQLDKSVLKQLEEQGHYPNVRKDLPLNPKVISLITSKHSKALDDFKASYERKNGTARIDFLDAFVQGEHAVEQIIRRIKEANHNNDTDIIVLTRGGGREEDFSAYNSYEVAEAICKSEIPIVTGIGHRPDETIADRVADQATYTPTDAAYRLAELSSQTKDVNSDISSSNSNLAIPTQYIVIGGIFLVIVTFIIVRLLLGL